MWTDGNVLVGGGLDGEVSLFDLRTDKPVWTEKIGSGQVMDIAVHHDVLAACADAGKVVIMEFE